MDIVAWIKLKVYLLYLRFKYRRYKVKHNRCIHSTELNICELMENCTCEKR